MELPNSWAVVGLSDICKIETGKWDANHATDNGKYRFYTCAYDFCFCDTKRFSGECLILAGNGANVGEVFFYNGEFDAYQRTYVISEIRALPKYLYYHFLWNWKRLNSDKQYGSATNYIRIGNFTDYKVFVSPLPEQHRIVAKIEALFSELDKGIESLKTAQQQLKIYRQALLKHAFSGKLTEQWRAENQDKLETAEALLQRIQTEREQRYQAQLKEWEINGKQGTKPKAPKVLPPLTDEELAQLPELPAGWFWGKLGLLTCSVEYGTSAKSSEIGICPVLRMGNIQNGKFDWSDLVFTNDEDEIKKYLLRNEDVLFNRTNSPELVGKSAIYKNERSAIFAGYLIRLNQIKKIGNASYLNFFLNSHTAKQHGNKVKTDGVNQSNINGEKLINYPFPFCSILEQTVIRVYAQ